MIYKDTSIFQLILRIGIIKSLIVFLLKLIKLLNIQSIAVEGTHAILFNISNSGIDFLPIE